ncbi:hypothetical protein ACOMHN_036389 [Nucella lapillus]
MADHDPTCNPMQPLLLQESETTPKNEQPFSQPGGPAQDDYKNFDIVRATQYGVLPRVRELVEAGFDVNQMDKENVSLLHWAAINNRIDIVKYFISKGSVVDRLGGDLNSTPLHWATRQGHLNMVVLLMVYGADPSVRDGEGYSCIHLAAQFGHTAIVAYLIAKGQDVDLPDKTGMTALIWAAYRVFGYDPVRLLLTFGASVNKADKFHGNTALHWACQTGNHVCVKMLLEAGANLDLVNSKGQSALDIAISTQNTELARRLRVVRYEQGLDIRHPLQSFTTNKGLDIRHPLQSFTTNKKVRKYVGYIFPFLALFVIGWIPEMEASLVFKLLLAIPSIFIWRVCVR